MTHATATSPALPGAGRRAALLRGAARLRRTALATAVLGAAALASVLPVRAAAPQEIPPLALAPLEVPPGPAGPSLATRAARAGALPSYATARQVHRAVNEATRYVDDMDLYGRKEFWTVARGAGDCEDYALAKRAALLAAGADPAALRLLTAWIASGEYHLVLVVTTTQGDYVLDARHAEPMTRQELEMQGYRWHHIEEGGRWFAVL